MLQYAQDAAETEKPWERWQWFSNCYSKWVDCETGFGFDSGIEYRRKPRTININGFEVPEPLRVAPKLGTVYYMPWLPSETLITGICWANDEYDNRMLSRGLVHLTEKAAALHAQALLSFTQK